VDALGAATALALSPAPHALLDRLAGDVAAPLERAQDLDERHLLPRLLDDLDELGLLVARLDVHFVHLQLDRLPDGEVFDVEHRRAPRLLHKLDVVQEQHHGGERREVPVAASRPVAASGVDLQLDADAAVARREREVQLADRLADLVQRKSSSFVMKRQNVDVGSLAFTAASSYVAVSQPANAFSQRASTTGVNLDGWPHLARLRIAVPFAIW
jgi:hypothetical protein